MSVMRSLWHFYYNEVEPASAGTASRSCSSTRLEEVIVLSTKVSLNVGARQDASAAVPSVDFLQRACDPPDVLRVGRQHEVDVERRGIGAPDGSAAKAPITT